MKLAVTDVLASEAAVKLVVVMELEGSENLVEYIVAEADPDKLVQ